MRDPQVRCGLSVPPGKCVPPAPVWAKVTLGKHGPRFQEHSWTQLDFENYSWSWEILVGGFIYLLFPETEKSSEACQAVGHTRVCSHTAWGGGSVSCAQRQTEGLGGGERGVETWGRDRERRKTDPGGRQRDRETETKGGKERGREERDREGRRWGEKEERETGIEGTPRRPRAAWHGLRGAGTNGGWVGPGDRDEGVASRNPRHCVAGG